MASAQELLGDPAGHSDAAYWDEWFDKVSSGTAFEWYCSTSDLLPVLSTLLPTSTPPPFILHAGTGNSSAPLEMSDFGYTHSCACDISPVAISEMNTKKGEAYPDLTFEVLDILQPLSQNHVNQYDCVIDKGLFDAMMSDSSSETMSKAVRLFKNVESMLKDGGIYFCVSLAEEHIVKLFIHILTSNPSTWSLSLLPLTPTSSTSSLRPFAFVLKKTSTIDISEPTFESLNSLITSSREEYSKNKVKKHRHLITLDVKPYESETDLNQLFSRLKSNPNFNGEKYTVIWKENELIEIGFGIMKLRIKCILDSDYIDEIVEYIAEIEEDEVQSVDVYWEESAQIAEISDFITH
ncbi:hypothetical protein TL16_g02864 [Triparma laevis f. inornata]|uniref:Translation elongation factor EF1B beta/delta subunit guanine nucleotide exchange domain-containing protein n=1 Tax=Triparma laevis f. inornata TaxID=1714386 RepID=A0A9W7DYA7_9STRA|nr:hypothetical protein TL16_g02864 [Triparma laevis f. inornata]